MRLVLFKICFGLGLAVSIGSVSLTVPVPAFAENVADKPLALKLRKVFLFDKKYEKLVDGFIADTKKRGFWSGSKNKDTEAQRLSIIRKILMQDKEKVVSQGANLAISKIGSRKTSEYLSHIEAGKFGSRPDDKELKEIVWRAYYDAIFSAMRKAGAKAQKEVGFTSD